MDKNGMTYAEYCQILKNEINNMELKKQDLDEKNAVFARCCEVKNDIVFLGLPRMQKILNDNQEKQTFKEILKYIFGYKFFDDMPKDEREEYEKNGYLMKDNLDEIFSAVYDTHYGQEFKKPTSWDDMLSFLNNNFKVFNSYILSNSAKVPFYEILSNFNIMIESAYANNIAQSRNISFILNMYNEFLNALDQKRKININDKEYSLIKNILNKDNRKFVPLEDSKEKKIGFGDTFIMFCELYNNELEKVQKTILENKAQSKIETQINKYHKRIKNMSFDKLENKNFPKYNNENYVQIIKGIIGRFLKDLNEDEKWLPYYTASQMHYASYFKTKYYDEDNFNKELERSCGGKNK